MERGGEDAELHLPRLPAQHMSDILCGVQHRYEYLHPKQTSIGKRVSEADEGCRDFLLYLLTVDPQERPTAEVALQHPWLQQQYPTPPAQ